MNKRTFCLLIIVAVAAITIGWSQTTANPPNPYKETLDRLNSITELPITAWRGHAADFPHPEAVSFDDSDWQPIKLQEPWNAASYWLRQTVEIPEFLNGYSLQGTQLLLDLWISGYELNNITVFSNGTMISQTDEIIQMPITLTTCARPGQKFVIAIRVLLSGQKADVYPSRLMHARLLVSPEAGRPDPLIMAMQIKSIRPLIDAYPEGKEEREQTLDIASKAIDFSALAQKDQAAFDASLRNAQHLLDQLRPYVKKFSIVATGNSHIDMAWLWPWTETVDVTRRTFASALELMREYPQLTFSMATAQTYAWMEDKYPEMFGEIQRRVKEGRWEIVGGMWVEPDLNLPDGESLTRQLLYGKRYFQQKFGVDVKVGWNPDSFGYTWQLAQIYKRAGVDYFLTQKLFWNDTTKFPSKLFHWEAPDGSSLLTYFPNAYDDQLDPLKIANNLRQYAPAMWKASPVSPQTPDGNLRMMFLFGIGDHGGGPTREDLDTGLRWQEKDIVFPEIHFDTAAKFFEDVCKHEAELKIPTWKDELYFQYHRGVQTTQADEKKRNRKSEVLILNAEKLAAIDALYGAAYPKSQFETAWKNVLFNQFHDILPGSGIHVNYVDAAERYDVSDRIATDITTKALNDLAANVKTGAPSLLVFNPLSWPRTDVIDAEIQMPNPVKRLSGTMPDGKKVPLEILENDHVTNRVKLRLLAQDVPSLGYLVVKLSESSTSASLSAFKASSTQLENEFLRVTIDQETGCITSLFDKHSQTEALSPAVQSEGSPVNLDGKPCGNLLQTFVDKPKAWDAWNIDADFVKQHTDLMKAASVKLIEQSPVRAIVRVEKHTEKSKFIQDITLYLGVPRLDVHMQADWNEKHVLLKVAFPASVNSRKATFEIPYGSIERPTTRRTPEEQAQFEVPALRWADLSDSSHGLSLLNDSKYGYDAKDNVIRLSLLRAPTWPDPHADEGHHEFTYSLYPHGGTWKDAMTVRQGYELNYPLLVSSMQAHQGPLPEEYSFASSEANNIIITALKQSEDDDSMVVRFYEWTGKEGNVILRLPRPAIAAYDTDLMERSQQPLSLQDGGNRVSIATKPYEIRTVRIQFTK